MVPLKIPIGFKFCHFFSIIDLLKSSNHGNTFNASIPLSNGIIERFEIVRTPESLPTHLHSTLKKGK
jgi:hypothetical protein